MTKVSLSWWNIGYGYHVLSRCFGVFLTKRRLTEESSSEREGASLYYFQSCQPGHGDVSN